MKRIIRLALAGAVLLAGCRSERSAMQKVMPPEADRIAREFIQRVAAGDTGRATALLDAGYRGARSAEALESFARALAGLRPDSLVAVNYAAAHVAGRWAYTAAYQSRLGANWVLFEVVLTKSTPAESAPGGSRGFTVTGLKATGMAKPLEEVNAFTFKGKSGAHYLILLFAAASLLFSLYTIVLVVHTRGVRRWAWVLACLVSAGSLRLNWTTGEAHFYAISLVLLGVSITRQGLVGPWIVQTAFPIGAALFHWRGQFKHHDRTGQPGNSPPAPEDPTPTG